MELLDAVASRRSIQTYASTPVPKETLLGLVEAARKAPSAANKNAWRFVLVTERQTLDRLSETHRFCGWLPPPPAANAPANAPAAPPPPAPGPPPPRRNPPPNPPPGRGAPAWRHLAYLHQCWGGGEGSQP